MLDSPDDEERQDCEHVISTEFEYTVVRNDIETRQPAVHHKIQTPCLETPHVLLEMPCSPQQRSVSVQSQDNLDKGIRAWSQVLMGHLINLNTWGYVNSFGIFEAYYVDELQFSTSAVAWIGSLQIFVLFFMGAFSGRALDAGYYRHVLIAGCFFQIFGIFMTSLSTQYWQFLLAQGLCQGIGHGLVFAPTIALVATYFTKHRSLAVAMMTGGSGTGGVIFVLMLQHLSPTVGFAWSMRIIGFLVLFNAVMIILLARPKAPKQRVKVAFEWVAFQELPYLFFVIGMFFSILPVFYDFTYINIFASNLLKVSRNESLNILLIFNGVSLPGRIIVAIIADRIAGPLNTLICLILLCSAFNFIWISISTYTGLLLFVIFFGLINAGLQGMFMSALTSLTTDMSKVGGRSGMVLAVVAFSTLIGGPIAGSLIDEEGGAFLGVQIFGGTFMLFGCGIVVAARLNKTGWVVKKWI